MEYNVYILRSKKSERYYIGCTKNLLRRLSEHNKCKVRSTKGFVPWEIVYKESFKSKSDAFAREREIKSYKSGIKFKRLLNNMERWQSSRKAG